jgi:uncharacterized membrane protein
MPEHDSAAAQWALFFHLVGAFSLVGGAIVAAVAFERARRREQPGEIAGLLGLARTGVVLVGAGAVLVLGFGLWLVDLHGYGYGAGWVDAALALFAVAMALGAAGGRPAKRARLLAERLAREGDAGSPELRALLADRLARAANYGSGAAVLAILVLMVWRPGS